jgi:hypothetical protein
VPTWTIDSLQNSENIPDDLRADLLGSRKTILFIEGTHSSRDQPLYATLFPNISVRHRATCADVRRAVIGLGESEAMHHARAFGLVDNDGMNEAYKSTLLGEGVYALSVFAVESLYYAPEVMASVAVRHERTFVPESAKAVEAAGVLVAAAKKRALATLSQRGKIERLASRIAERQMRDKLLEALPDRAEMLANGDRELNVTIQSPYPETLRRIRLLLEAGDLDAIIASFPVRESGILGDIAKELRFKSFADYERAAVTAIQNDPSLAELIKAKLGGLAERLL